MHISVNTDEPLSDLDKQILAVLAGTTSTVPIADKASEAAARVAAATAKAAPAKKAAAPEPEPEEEDLVGGTTARTKDEAIAYATNLVANGGASKVRAALKEIGAAKVTEMDESDAEKFFALVDAED